MKLNKKYQFHHFGSQNTSSFEGVFPVFLPSYQTFSLQQLGELILQDIQWKAISRSLGKHLIPLFIDGALNKDFTKVLFGKASLPYLAREKRLFSVYRKTQKKNQTLLSQFFGNEGIHFCSTFQNERIQRLFDLLEEKQIWKLSQELVWWDVTTQTIVEPEDIVWKEEVQTQLEVKCFVETKNDVFPLVIDDPLQLFSDKGVLVHPNDKRYKKHIGKKIIIPILNKSIPIFGEEGLDTVKDNGIFRLNPLLGEYHLRKTQQYRLSLQDEVIDEKGFFVSDIPNFGGKPAFDFVENITETLATIGNLVSKQEVKKKIPYSSETNTRLIRRIVPGIILDFSQYGDDFGKWMEKEFPELSEEGRQPFSVKLSLESKNIYQPRLPFLCNVMTGDVRCFRYQICEGSCGSAFSSLLLYLLVEQQLPFEFSISDLFDALYFMSEERWNTFFDQFSFSVSKEDSLFALMKSNDHEMISERIGLELEKIPWLQMDAKGIFRFLPTVLFGDQWTLHSVACSDVFLQSLACLSRSQDLKLFFQQQQVFPSFLEYFLWFSFVLQETSGFSFVPFHADEKAFPLQARWESELSDYGLDVLRFTVARGKAYTESDLAVSFEYLKHLWNLFKVLYEQGVFELDEVGELRLGGKEYWLFSQWKELLSAFEGKLPGESAFSVALGSLQDFTRGAFSWYLALVKGEAHEESRFLAGQLFLSLLELLSPIIPEFVSMIGGVLEFPVKSVVNREELHGVKDYRTFLLFDILKGIQLKRAELQLKKHLPIALCVQANSDILRLIESYELSLKLLFKTEEIQYLAANEVFPSGFGTFMILDITVGIKALDLPQHEDCLAQLEKEHASKLQTLEYLRSTLVALSLNPLADPVKLAEKESELDQLKSEIQELELNIKKMKATKKV